MVSTWAIHYTMVLTKTFINIGFPLWVSPGPWSDLTGSSTSQLMQVRIQPRGYVSILDQLKDKFHLGLIGLVKILHSFLVCF